ncbi:MAG: hypothetical protein FWE24_09160 [Defluviitaleaceae bacterium]|nr:hypothetical protein [Defluviitaleaceae bacterium]
MKKYEGLNITIIVSDENISIVNKKGVVKKSFTFIDITALMWCESKGAMPGDLKVTIKENRYTAIFPHENRETFLELRDLIAQKSGVEFQVETFGGQVFDIFKTGLKGLFWLGLGVILMLSALQSMFGIFG